jgi:GTP-binding protein HflX
MRRRIGILRRQIESVRKHREHQRRQRRKRGIPVISLAGYTNAGKSSLLGKLSNADVLVRDQLFATLDPTTRRVRLPGGREVLFSDTVGFIHRLPPDLVAAFRATLEEITDADLILHLVDITHPKAEAQLAAVERVLVELGAERDRIVTVWNKIDGAEDLGDPADQAGPADKSASNHALKISALTGEGIDALLERVESLLKASLQPVELLLPYSAGDLIDEIHRQGSVRRVEHREDGTYIHACLPAPLVRRLARAHPRWFVASL